MRDPESVVRDFCAACARRDIDELLGFFADDAVYHNIPLEPVVGLDGIREIMQLFVPGESLEFDVRHLASRGHVVFTERVDRMRIGGKDIALPVAGVFEIRDGKIAAWRDYFDLATWQRQAR